MFRTGLRTTYMVVAGDLMFVGTTLLTPAVVIAVGMMNFSTLCNVRSR